MRTGELPESRRPALPTRFGSVQRAWRGRVDEMNRGLMQPGCTLGSAKRPIDQAQWASRRADSWQHEAPQAQSQQSQKQSHRGQFRVRPGFHLNPPAALGVEVGCQLGYSLCVRIASTRLHRRCEWGRLGQVPRWRRSAGTDLQRGHLGLHCLV